MCEKQKQRQVGGKPNGPALQLEAVKIESVLKEYEIMDQRGHLNENLRF